MTPSTNWSHRLPWTSPTRARISWLILETGDDGITFQARHLVEEDFRRSLLNPAAQAGGGRIVHFSVANASSESRLPYFRGKGRMEEILQDMGIPYAFIRPTLVFGEGDLLLNNMA